MKHEIHTIEEKKMRIKEWLFFYWLLLSLKSFVFPNIPYPLLLNFPGEKKIQKRSHAQFRQHHEISSTEFNKAKKDKLSSAMFVLCKFIRLTIYRDNVGSPHSVPQTTVQSCQKNTSHQLFTYKCGTAQANCLSSSIQFFFATLNTQTIEKIPSRVQRSRRSGMAGGERGT